MATVQQGDSRPNRLSGGAPRGGPRSPANRRTDTRDEWSPRIQGLVEPYLKRDQAEKDRLEEVERKLNVLRKELSDRSAGKDEWNRKEKELRHQLDQLSKEISSREETRKQFLDEVDEKQRVGRDRRDEVAREKKAIGYQTIEEVNDRINEIETIMRRVPNYSIHEEKKLMDEIASLKKKIPQVTKYAELESSVNSEEKGVVPLKSKIEETKKDLNKLRDERKKFAEKLNELRNERRTAMTPSFDVSEEDALRKEMKDIMMRRHEIKQEYFAEAQKHQAEFAKKRTERNQKIQAEKRLQQMSVEMDRIQSLLESIDDLPFAAEINRLEQLISYVETLKNPAFGTGPAPVKEVSSLEGTPGVLLSKNQRDDDYMIAPTGQKKQKKKKETHKGQICHNADTLNDFQAAGVTGPLTAEEFDKCLDALKSKSKGRKEEQKVAAASKLASRESLEKQLAELKERLNEALQSSGAPSPAPVEG